MSSILDKIISDKKQELETTKKSVPISALMDLCAPAPAPLGFAKAISGHNGPAIIAELKKASPTKGLLCPDFSIERLAGAYASGGAAA
ncbi:MAG: indole-3-glycerol phosphate synthase, partial [Chloroflexi bacterium CG07_land_8_20_14_0_80_51_10]